MLLLVLLVRVGLGRIAKDEKIKRAKRRSADVVSRAL